MQCKKCLGEILEEDTFCRACGTRVEKEVVAMDLKKCNHCHCEINFNAIFCTQCGNKVESELRVVLKTCNNCHTPLEEDEVFCTFCGNIAQVENTPTQINLMPIINIDNSVIEPNEASEKNEACNIDDEIDFSLVNLKENPYQIEEVINQFTSTQQVQLQAKSIVVTTVKCAKCESIIDKDDVFCKSCGAIIENANFSSSNYYVDQYQDAFESFSKTNGYNRKKLKMFSMILVSLLIVCAIALVGFYAYSTIH